MIDNLETISQQGIVRICLFIPEVPDKWEAIAIVFNKLNIAALHAIRFNIGHVFL